MKRYFVSLAIVLICTVATTLAQDPTPTKVNNQNRTGPLPFSTSIGTDVESVDIATGKLRVAIPIVSVPGRGMDSSFYLRYDSLFWVSPAYVGPQQELVYEWKIESNGGLFPDLGFGWNVNKARITNGSVQFPCNGQTANYATNYIYHDPDGGKHPLAVKGATASPCAVQDWNGPDLGGEGIWAKKLSSVGDPEIYLADGTRYVENMGWRDPNGNTKAEDPKGPDTLDRNIVTQTHTSSQVFYHVKDSNGQQQTFTLNFETVMLSTAFNVWAPNGNGNIREFGNPTPIGRRALKSVVLPNGQSYQFQYEQGSYGGITRIDLPTGAYITYTWTTITNGSQSHRVVASRTVHINGQEQRWTFDRASGKVTDPLGNESIYSAIDGAIQNVKQYNGAAAGNPMREYIVDYVWDADPWDGITIPSGTLEPYEPQKVALRPIRITTKFHEANLVSKKEFDYETFTYPYHPNFTVTTFGQVVNFTTSRGNVTEIREYDWGTGTPGPLLRRTTNGYLHNLNGNYLPKNIVSKIVTTTIYDSTANTCRGLGQPCAQTQYEYDSTAVIDTNSTAPAPQHDYTNYGSGFTFRGNATRVKRWFNITGGVLSTTYNYDDLGNIRSITDPLNHTTSFSYANNFPNWNCLTPGSNPSAWVTQTTNHLGHNAQIMYFGCTGLVNWKRDQNDINAGRLGTTFTYDLMNRPLQQNFADGGQKVFTYDDNVTFYSPNVREDTLLNPSGTGDPGTCQGDKWATSWTKVDGLGRVDRTEKCNGLAAPLHVDMVDTCYDELGRKAFVTYPFQGGGWTQGSYLCSNSQRPGDTFTYDALSRPLTVTNTDGDVVGTTYFSGHQVTVTDQAGKKRKSQTDALGRLIKVWEPDGGGSFIYETAYQYDTLGNLLRVDQKGNDPTPANWRTRTFQYDSLSRLTQAVNPESGTITFGYDSDGNLTSKVAPAPNQTGSATVTTTFTYDELHRLTGKTAPTHGAGLVYDQSPMWGVTVQNPVGRLVGTYATIVGMPGSGGVGSVPSYDAMGRVISEVHFNQHVIPWAPLQTFNYQYNVDGSLKSLTYPSGRRLDYTYNRGQRPVSMVDAANSINYATDATYTAWGALKGMKNGVTATFAGITTTNNYNSRMQPLFLSAAAPGGTVMSFGYDFHLGAGNNGNVFQIVNNLNNDRTQIFAYDELNRIATAKTQALIGQHCWGHTFGYDIWANLTSRGALSGYEGCTGEGPVPAATVKNQMAGHPYDAAGNYLPAGYSYDAENRLISASGSIEFDYDSSGRRVRKSSGANGTLYWYGAGGEVLQETNLSGGLLREFIYFNGKRTARRDANNTVHYYFSDHLGSSNVVTDASAVIKEESDFYPFGGERVVTNLLADQNYKFTGKERDFETNLDYFGARYYAFNFGRFITPDEFTGGPVDAISPSDPLPPGPLPYADISNPQSLNKYTYTINNPLRYTDPDGHCIWDFCIIEFTVGAKIVIGVTGAAIVATAGIAAYQNSKNSNDSTTPPPAVPNPHGSKGAPDHQSTAEAERARIGGEREVPIPIPPGGHKDTRRADAANVGPDGKVLPGGEVVQVYRPTPAGNIPKREQEAARDIQRATGELPTLVPVRPVPDAKPSPRIDGANAAKPKVEPNRR